MFSAKDLLMVQGALNHRFVGTTMRYAGVSTRVVEAAAALCA